MTWFMMENDNNYDGIERQTPSDDDISEWFRSVRPKNYITMVNTKKYREFEKAVCKIKAAIDATCLMSHRNSDEVKYKIFESGFYRQNLVFAVYLPGDGFSLHKNFVMEILDALPDGTKISVGEANGGRVLFDFDFMNLNTVISSE